MKQLLVVSSLVVLLSSCELEDALNQNFANTDTQTQDEQISQDDLNVQDDTNTQIDNSHTDTQTIIEINTDTETETTLDDIVEEIVQQNVFIQEKTSLNIDTESFPKLYYFDVLVPALSDYEIYVNDNLTIENRSGLGDLFGPASGIRSSHTRITHSIVVEQSGEQEVSVIHDNEEQMITFNASSQECVSNEVYFNEEIENKLTACLACHSTSGSAPYSFESFSLVENYIEGHARSLSTQPSKTYHGGGLRFAADDSTSQAIQILEYRVANNWVCL